MAGDVVRRAVEFSGDAVRADEVLQWLADRVRALRDAPTVTCGAAGTFTVTEEAGTVEINPQSRQPVGGYSNRSLTFTSSAALNEAVSHNVLTAEALDSMADDDPIANAFGRALAAELVLARRAAIGNFGVWTIGQKPDLQHFVRFRPRPAINQML